MPIEHIRLSKEAAGQLGKLKRWTGIRNWNVLCRWAFCISIAEPSKPSILKIPGDSTVEMTWKTFGGQFHEIYYAILKERCMQDGFGISEEALATQFKLHLHRGISYLASNRNIANISDFIQLAPLDSVLQ